ADPCCHEGVDGRPDDRLEDPTGEVKAADEAGYALHTGEPLRVAQHVHRARMRAARHDDETLVLHVDDRVLVIPDHRIEFPTRIRVRVVDREALLERGEPLHLAGDEDGRVEKQRLSRLLDHLDALAFEVAPARRRKLKFGPGREDDLALPPRLGMDDKREAPPTIPPETRFKPAV